MNFAVKLTAQAERDLLDIYRYVAANDAPAKAEGLLDNLEKVIESLETLPQRGHCPPELERIGMMEYRELFFKPYRVIYRITGKDVCVYAVLDGRRDIPDLLQERMLR
ncbi:type II toxin-antitoxin system RelE/ParE family toxin [Geotalea uraniireducens]|uniref:Plasmid stabilization system n=1 Tax=Geotalea uraniireducens (strain Rf4) TaxID=351605 RepID=A5GE31_GEOUR|nr:type II toxin-antitoxin system RelE/ParE family toxin [Geotalea uraniireducens]ABQ25686.1 plasmid stabilization system [Geotalea uraniireducens Rf4]